MSADELNERGRALASRGRLEEAVTAYRAAAAADPEWSVPWYNLGLVHKYRREWRESAECCTAALARDDSDGDAWWNLGIASTALGDWAAARVAWARCGITVPPGEGPIEGSFGLTPVRLDPGGRGVVVWCDRVDPARAIIRNVPLPESGYRWGDVMLHDGAPNGVRIREGREVPVFDALQRLEESSSRTYVLDVPGASADALLALSDVALRMGGAAEDWSRSMSYLCRRCSEGRPHDEHDQGLRGERPDLAVGAAASGDEHLERIIAEWRATSGHPGYVGWTPAG